jgi:hypothetical protein
VRLKMGSVEEGGLEAGRTLLSKSAHRSEQFVSISFADLFVDRHSAGALVWILRLLARRLIQFLAGLSGLIALSILLTILVGIAVITSP